MADLLGLIGKSIAKSLWIEGVHAKNKITLGEEEAARIREEKARKIDVKNRNEARIMGYLVGIMIGIACAVEGGSIGLVAAITVGPTIGYLVNKLFLFLSANPYR